MGTGRYAMGGKGGYVILLGKNAVLGRCERYRVVSDVGGVDKLSGLEGLEGSRCLSGKH